MVHEFTERLFGGGGGKHSLTTPKRPGTGRRSTPKRLLCLFIVTGIFVSLCGCGASDSKEAESDKQPTDYEVQTAIKEQLENLALPKGYSALLEDDFITVLCKDGEVTVTITASANFVMPYVAEKFLPAAKEAVEAMGVTLARFDVNSYVKMEDGIADETWASWQTKDGETGILTDDTEGTAIVKQGLTIEALYEYYSDYEEIVKTLITEAGGSYE